MSLVAQHVSECTVPVGATWIHMLLDVSHEVVGISAAGIERHETNSERTGAGDVSSVKSSPRPIPLQKVLIP